MEKKDYFGHTYRKTSNFIPGTKLGVKKKLSSFVAGIKFSGGGHQDGSCSAIKPDKMK